MKINYREKMMILLAFLLFVFYLFWVFVINPKIENINYVNSQIDSLNSETKLLYSKMLSNTEKYKIEVKIYKREEQVNYIVGAIVDRFKKDKIKLVSLKQSEKDNNLVFDVEFNGQYKPIVAFLNSIKDLDTFVIIKKVSLSQDGDSVTGKIVLLSAYL